MQHLVQYDSQRPNVVFDGVNIKFQTFRTHVQWAANVNVILWIVGDFFSESEVGDFGDFVFDEDVGWFQISMKKVVFGNGSKSVNDVPENGDGLILRKLLSFLE